MGESMNELPGSFVRLAVRILFSALVGLGLATLVVTAPGLGQPLRQLALVRIDLTGTDDLARLAVLELPVYAHLTAPGGDYLLAALTHQHQSHLLSLDFALTVLDPDARGAVYYLIESGRPGVAERISSIFTLVHDDGRQAVGRLREGVSLPAVDSLGLPVARLDLDPIVLFPRATTGVIPTTPLYDSLVAELLNQITDISVSGYDGRLSGEWPVLVGGQSYLLTTRYSYSGEPIAKATQYVYEHLQARGYDVRFHDYSLSPGGYSLRNVVGEKRGLDHADQVFLLTAHLDSRAAAPPHDPAPGADDNASGSAALLIAADLLADLDFAYTIRIVFFTGEEQGMYGSYYYARDVAGAGEEILGVLNLDMIAWDAKDGPDIDLHSHLPGTEDDSDALADLFAAVVDLYGLDLEPQIVENGTSFSDHSRFWDRGYAAILAIEDYYNPYESPAEPRDWNSNYHTVNDRLSTLNLAYFREYARASLATFVHLAGPMRTLDGTVTDADTAVPLSAEVTARGQDSVFTGTAEISGQYSIVLPAGFYTVTASAQGYYPQTIVGFALLTGTGKTLDFALRPISPTPSYDFTLLGKGLCFGQPMERVTHTVTIVNTGALSDVYDLALSPSAWTTTLPFTRSAVLFPHQLIAVPLTVTIPPQVTKGDQDQVTLTVTSVYSSVYAEHIVLRTVVGHEVYLPLVLRDLQTGPPPESCVEGMANGGFEYDGDWEIPVTKYPASYTAAAAHSGSRSMRVGITEPTDNSESYSSARQSVVVPTGATSVTLRFWLYPVSGEPAALAFPVHPPAPTLQETTLASDAQYVLVLDENDLWIDTLLWQRTNDRQWRFHQFDLMAYAGQTIKLHFGVYNDGWGGVTGMYLDDVSLEVCSAALSP